eukprot:s1198_g6.t1
MTRTHLSNSKSINLQEFVNNFWGGGCRPNLFQLPWHEQIVEISQPLIQGLRITFAIAKKPCSQATFYSRKGTSLFS